MLVTEQEIDRECALTPGLDRLQAYFRIRGRKDWLSRQPIQRG